MPESTEASVVASVTSLSPGGDHLQEFELQAKLLGAEVLMTDVAGIHDVIQDQISAWTTSIGVSSDLLELFPELARMQSLRDDHVELAITRGRLGIAFSGSVLIAEFLQEDRTLSMLCRRHMILLSARQIVAHLMEATPLMRELTRAGCRYLTFISGPSRTADIEKILTIGAHGPTELKIILIHGWEPDDNAPVC